VIKCSLIWCVEYCSYDAFDVKHHPAIVMQVELLTNAACVEYDLISL